MLPPPEEAPLPFGAAFWFEGAFFISSVMVVRPLLVTLLFDLTDASSPPFWTFWAVPLAERTLRLDWVAVPLVDEPEVERRTWVPELWDEVEELVEEEPLERRTVVPVLWDEVEELVEEVPVERRTWVPELWDEVEELVEEDPLERRTWEEELLEEEDELLEEPVPVVLLTCEEEEGVVEVDLEAEDEELPEERTVLEELLLLEAELDEDEELPLERRTCAEEELPEEREEEDVEDTDGLLVLLEEDDEETELVVLVADPDEPVRRVCAERSAGSMIKAATIAEARAE